mgnify:CR=1 FL=1
MPQGCAYQGRQGVTCGWPFRCFSFVVSHLFILFVDHLIGERVLGGEGVQGYAIFE